MGYAEESPMGLHIQLPADVEQRYSAEAKARGVSLERYLAERLIETAPSEAATGQRDQTWVDRLPKLKGRVTGSLHRRDIYDDRV
jgi:hypothetical protein